MKKLLNVVVVFVFGSMVLATFASDNPSDNRFNWDRLKRRLAALTGFVYLGGDIRGQLAGEKPMYLFMRKDRSGPAVINFPRGSRLVAPRSRNFGALSLGYALYKKYNDER